MLPRLREQQKDKLDAHITIEELEQVIKNSKLNKAPGPDGFSNEFFKSFGTDLIHWLFRAHNDAKLTNSLSDNSKRGTIPCIP